jgi:hypothetical protein
MTVKHFCHTLAVPIAQYCTNISKYCMFKMGGKNVIFLNEIQTPETEKDKSHPFR